MLYFSIALLCVLTGKMQLEWAVGCWPTGLFSTEKNHLGSFRMLLPSNCRAARCSSLILSISSFLFSIWAISSAVTVTGAASAVGGDLPESTVGLREERAGVQGDTQLLGQDEDQAKCAGL